MFSKLGKVDQSASVTLIRSHEIEQTTKILYLRMQ